MNQVNGRSIDADAGQLKREYKNHWRKEGRHVFTGKIFSEYFLEDIAK